MVFGTSHYEALFLQATPMLDVRAPIEFAKGAFPLAVNRPLLLDDERQQVGTCYKQNGQDAAIKLGHRLVAGQAKTDRITSWGTFVRDHPDGYLYCFRGGLRSQITQQWIYAHTGVHYPYVVGGYKAMRAFLLENIERTVADSEFLVLGGLTGSGKTEVLNDLDHSLDLEGHAHHRGSSFGRHATGQPTQINFENSVSVDMLQKRRAGHRLFVLEDESRMIGRCAVPLSLHRRMGKSPVVWLEDTLSNRVQRILRDYVVNLLAEYTAMHEPGYAFSLFAAQLTQNLSKLAKRLGAGRYQCLAGLMDQALREQERSGRVDLHRPWITGLLNDYYDPMYAYQRTQRITGSVFTGDRNAVHEYLRYSRTLHTEAA